MKFGMKTFLLILTAILFVCCSVREDNKAAQMVKELNTTDTFHFEFPFYKYKYRTDSSLYFSKLEYDSLLGISNMINGVDSIEIRIWFGYTTYIDTFHLLAFKIEKGKWSGQVCTLIDKWEYYERKNNLENNPWREDSIVHASIKKNCIAKEPKSGWDKFIKNFFELGILTLADVADIEGWKHGLSSHSTGPTIEIATKNTYRYYRYYDLDTVYNNFWQTKNICEIIELLKKEFNFKLILEQCYTDSDIMVDTTD